MLAKHGWIWQSLSCYSALLALLTLFTRVGRVWVLPISAGQTFHSETTKFGSVWYYLKQYGVYAPWAHNSCQASLPFPTIIMSRPVEKRNDKVQDHADNQISFITHTPISEHVSSVEATLANLYFFLLSTSADKSGHLTSILLRYDCKSEDACLLNSWTAEFYAG